MLAYPVLASTPLFPQEIPYSFLWFSERGCEEKTKKKPGVLHPEVQSMPVWGAVLLRGAGNMCVGVGVLMDMEVALCISSRNVQTANESVSVEGRLVSW